MKISKSFYAKICIATGFLLSASSMFGMDIIIRKGDSVPPPEPMPAFLSVDTEIPASATVDSRELVVNFEWSVGEAIITVYDQYGNVLYQGVADTDTDLSTSVSSGSWSAGNYTLTISYGTEHLIGDFHIE